jgi:hypothetical protein
MFFTIENLKNSLCGRYEAVVESPLSSSSSSLSSFIVVADLLPKRKRNDAKDKMLFRANKRDKQAAKKKDMYCAFIVP